MRLEGVDRVAVEGRDEHDHRHALLRHLGDDVEAGNARHLDVEEHQVRLVLGDRGDRFAAVGTLAHDRDVGCALQAQFEAATSKRLVVDDDGTDAHVGCVASSSGSVISRRSPGRENRTAICCCSP